MLHKIVQVFLHILGPRRREQAAMTQGARTEFGGSLKPGNNLSRSEELDCFVNTTGSLENNRADEVTGILCLVLLLR